jgi:hypothetical protein
VSPSPPKAATAPAASRPKKAAKRPLVPAIALGKKADSDEGEEPAYEILAPSPKKKMSSYEPIQAYELVPGISAPQIKDSNAIFCDGPRIAIYKWMVKLFQRYTEGEYCLYFDIRAIEARCGKNFRYDLDTMITIPFEKVKWLLTTLNAIKGEMKSKKGYLVALGGKEVERSRRHCDCVTSFLDVGVIAMSPNVDEAILRLSQSFPQVRNAKYPAKGPKVINITVTKHFTHLLKATQYLLEAGATHKFQE